MEKVDALMCSQTNSEDSDADSDGYANDDLDIQAYYDLVQDHPFRTTPESVSKDIITNGLDDPETCDYQCLSSADVDRLLRDYTTDLCRNLQVSVTWSKVLLNSFTWNSKEITKRYIEDRSKLLTDARLVSKQHAKQNSSSQSSASACYCAVCVSPVSYDEFLSLDCEHKFCSACWVAYIEMQLLHGISTYIECMENGCSLIVPEDFVLKTLQNSPQLKQKYLRLSFYESVKNHPELTFCPGPNCDTVIRSEKMSAKKVTCWKCNTSFCFKCGGCYHAPTDCETIKRWLIKCADDSETANYITAHTKDCPKCQICIEKNGGCNHMQCWKCKHHFCWMCLGDWKTHGSEYYECSRYKENPDIANQSQFVKAREALQKYLFYFERWENHNKSLKLEEQLLQRIKERIDGKILNKEGTWIDWQYLYNAAALLTKCRYTLQYTYPYAYFMDFDPRKQLFEYQQAQLEREIENLSWKVERAETTDRGDLENQMNIAEQKRRTLLKDFHV